MLPKIELLVTSDCPNDESSASLVYSVLESMGLPSTLERVRVESLADAELLAFPGSPTVRVDGRDVEPDAPEVSALACRTYGTEGVPARWMIEVAILRTLRPGHLLFLCVANSSRSQMGEGIARSLAPDTMRISSAGSEPSQVRPQAIAVLSEVGIDIRGYRSKGTEEVARPVDVVITLCAQEVCPVWLDPAVRLHWALPDPAGAGDTSEEEMRAFRQVRDELRLRLSALLADTR